MLYSQGQRTDWWFSVSIDTANRLYGENGVGKTGEDGQKVHTYGYKKNKLWRCNVQPGD